MLFAMTALTASPTLFPICATALKTPPASACVLSGNALVITRFDAVNNTSHATALSAIEGKTYSQYGSLGSITAVRIGEMHEMRMLITMAQSARSRWITAALISIVTQRSQTSAIPAPMKILTSTPVTGSGRKRIDASVAERYWTSWKKNVNSASIELNAPGLVD